MRLGSVAAAVLTFVAGCYDPDVKLGIPCSATGDCPEGQACDSITNTCLPPTELRTWRDDTAADFNQTGAILTDAVVEANGAVGPVAYATGRVRLSAVDGNHVGDPATATWASVDLPRTGTSFAPGFDVSYGLAAPEGLGTTATDNITVLLEGEVELDAAGTWRFELTANDAGFVDIAAPGGDFQRLVSDKDVATTATYTVVTPGWYRVRAAFADSSMYMDFTLRMDSPALPGAFRDITSDQVRARVDDLSGYLLDGFDDSYLLGYEASTLVTTPLMLSLPSDPYGIIIGQLTMAARATGQFLIDTEGDYAFTLSSHNGHRAWIDGVQVANQFAGSDAISNIPAMHLGVGWHDLVVDVTKSGDSADTTLSMIVASGPVWSGQAIPVDHVRPLPPRIARWTSARNSSTTTITDAASITRTISYFTPANAVPGLIMMNYAFTHSLQAQVGIVLDPPVGSNITLLAPGALTGAGTYTTHATVPIGDAGSTWSLIASDNTADAVVGTLENFNVTMIYDGGREPFPRAYRYESAPKDLGNVVGLGALTWQARQGTVKIQVRSCADAASCAAVPWVDVAASGDTPAISPLPFVQYAIDFTSDGDTATALDWIELAYSARPLAI